ncbi:hypothetical protein CFD26_106912 [Aspergillus turcosus]|uniref:DUF7730 domain-containing protein n=1 Tax=Aspergillus turcosus TaxID=1245748 RepID=A0A421D765_9EURO|nr:hypothetical protein CFD26_106912 [Aspergillus turcosus]
MVPVTAEGSRSLMPTGFLHLPYELRRQIYCHCIPRKRQINVSFPSLPLEPLEDPNGSLEDPEGTQEDPEGSLEDPKDHWYMEHFLNPNSSRLNVLRLSKQISEECLNILYGENIFHANLNGGGEYSLRNDFTEENRHRMRYLIIIAGPAGVSYETSMPDDSL